MLAECCQETVATSRLIYNPLIYNRSTAVADKLPVFARVRHSLRTCQSSSHICRLQRAKKSGRPATAREASGGKARSKRSQLNDSA